MTTETAWPVALTALDPVACGALLYRHRGALRASVVVKATFSLVHGGLAALVAPAALVRDEQRFENNPMRSVRAAGDLVPYRPAVDVTLVGHACAPAGPVPAMAVRLSIHRGAVVLNKTIHVFGDRSVAEPARAASFERMPLRYERAYGGLSFEQNPIGLGAGPGAAALPNLVDPRDPRRVTCFGPTSRYAAERRRLLGDADRARVEARTPEIPEPFAWEYFQSAPADQRLAALHGDEWIVLDGVHPTLPRVQAQLPSVRAAARAYGAGPPRGLELVADTLAIDADALRCSIVWRGALPLPEGEASLAGMHVVVALARPGAAIVWPEASELVQPTPPSPGSLSTAAAAPRRSMLARTVDDWSASAASGLQATALMAEPPPPVPLSFSAPVSAPVPLPPPAPAAAPAPRPALSPVPTLWKRQAVWCGELGHPDRLRIEARDGTVSELRLDPDATHRLGRVAGEGEERNDLVVPEVASRFAATLRHDGVRYWLRRRPECSVPITVGARSLDRGEEAPLVHAVALTVGDMRAVFADRRYLTPAVAAGSVDPLTGLLGRAGLELEIGCLLERGAPGALFVAVMPPSGERAPGAAHAPAVLGVLSVHRRWPTLPIGVADGVMVAPAPGKPPEIAAAAVTVASLLRGAGLGAFALGTWSFAGAATDAARELELALAAVRTVPPDPAATGAVVLRDLAQRARLAAPAELGAAASSARRATLLFAIEEQRALGEIGPQVLDALSGELAAVVAGHAGPGALVAPLAPGVVAACVPRSADARELGGRVQCDWHARPPVTDGFAEHPRSLSWELVHAVNPAVRAAEISRESADAHGVLSALGGGLPYPIAGLVHAALAASSATERVKMLFDVLEGTWRFMATLTLAAVLARPGAPEPPEPLVRLARRLGTRSGYPLGTWREIARTAAAALDAAADPLAETVLGVLDVKVGENQTFETLSNLMQADRNAFAHGQTNEARAAADLPAFEQMTRTFLRALRPLKAFTLVTVEKALPDPYGDSQVVEYIDHTGPFDAGVRRRIGLSTPVRLASVVYLARWRDGLALPLEPLIRRVAREDRFDLYWMDHLPRPGACQLSSVIGGLSLKVPFESLRVPPPLRALCER